MNRFNEINLKLPEEIANEAEQYSGKANKAYINREFKKQSDDHLYPINNRFSSVDRAIRRVQKFEREAGFKIYGLEYALALDAHISEIVNNEV